MRRGTWGILLAALSLGAAAAVAVEHPWSRGYALYHGYLPMSGRIAGHTEGLPLAASRCSNCHDAVTGGGQTARTISPLTQASLTGNVSRRGGPPSIFDQQSFCLTLRDGIDPAMIQVSRTMPRFTMSDDDCGALWYFASRR